MNDNGTKLDLWLTMVILVIAALLAVVAVAVLLSGDDGQDPVHDEQQDEQRSGVQEGEEDVGTDPDTQEADRVEDGLYRATAE